MSSSPSKGHSLPAHLIPQRISSKLQNFPAYANAVENSRKRKASTQSQLVQLTTSSSVADFLSLKLKDAQDDANDFSKLYDIAQEAFQEKIIDQIEYNQMTFELEKKREEKDDEVLLVKKQRKIVTEDLEEQLAGEGIKLSKLEEEYAALMTKCMTQASDDWKKIPINHSRFQQNVWQHLEAERYLGTDGNGKKIVERWCHVLGMWLESGEIKTAHLVPASMNGPEVSYTFGVQQLNLEDARIGITVHRVIEKNLDTAQVVFVPVPHPGQGLKPLQWKLVVTDPTILNLTGPAGTKWKDVDGKILTFRGAGRPARRYLYFRFIMTYLLCKNRGRSLEWAQTGPRGYIWATPGPYLRKGMLAAMGKVAGDMYMPEAWEMELEKSTFIDADGSPAVDEQTERNMSRKLSMKMEQASIRKEDSDDEDEE